MIVIYSLQHKGKPFIWNPKQTQFQAQFTISNKKRLTAMLANPFLKISFLGAEGQNRTADTGIFSPLLYRLSYLGFGF
jgi:hypothetical protein